MTKRKAKWILFWHSIFGCHFFWRWRENGNPYWRQCKVCKRTDSVYSWGLNAPGWWETVSDGKHGETNGVYVKSWW